MKTYEIIDNDRELDKSLRELKSLLSSLVKGDPGKVRILNPDFAIEVRNE